MKKLFTGVATALVTPFKKNEIDFTAMGRHINAQIAQGVDALIVLGTTGEASTLTLNEKHAVIAFAMEVVAGRIPVIVGIGGNNPANIIELGQYAKSQGVAGVMVTAPYYNKATQAGLVRFFTTIAGTLKMPMIVYNVPGRAGVNILPQTLAEISRHRWVAGIKEASGDIGQIAEAVRLSKKPVYGGDDGLALPCYSVGCVGIISVASNVDVQSVKDIWLAHKRSANTLARSLFYEQLPFYRALFCEVNPIPVKYVLSTKGVCRNELRLPLTPLTSELQALFHPSLGTSVNPSK